MTTLIKLGKRCLPSWVKSRVKELLVPTDVRDRDYDLGMFILEQIEKFSMRQGGCPESLHAGELKDCILNPKCLSEMNAAHQHMQTVLMPHYERSLYEYYRQQQYLILLTFLSYAFRGPNCLASHIDPYLTASSKLPRMRILDYGAGLAYGLIHLLRTYPERVEAITIVDLDLIHTELVEFILSNLCSDVTVNVMRITNSEVIPNFGDRTFNLIYGKDIFEHVHNPELLLKAILSKAEPYCVGYFDINDHGEKYLQHVHPDLSHLSGIICDYSFVPNGKVSGLSEFVKSPYESGICAPNVVL